MSPTHVVSAITSDLCISVTKRNSYNKHACYQCSIRDQDSYSSQIERPGRHHSYAAGFPSYLLEVDDCLFVSAITVLSPKVGKNGFPFANADEDSPFPGAEDDPLYGSKYLRDLYLKANPDYSGR